MLGTIVFGLVAPVFAHSPADHACHYRPPGAWVAEVEAAAARGEIDAPATRRLPAVAPRTALAGVDPTPCLSTLHVFPHEDSAQVLLTNFSDGQLLNLMADGANALMVAHGDNFDFIGYWLNLVPDHTIGAAFYNNSNCGARTTGRSRHCRRPTSSPPQGRVSPTQRRRRSISEWAG